jgi:amidase
MKRRDFLATVSLGLAAGLPEMSESLTAAPEVADRAPSATEALPIAGLEFASALDAAEAIRKKRISSADLTQQVFARIDKYNPKLNAFAYQLRVEALARARQADEAQARGRSLGPLHGVPIHVKESFAVAGHPCTWGIPQLKDSKAPEDSVAVARLLAAGGVLLGATNVPIYLGDWQSYNDIYGQTNNPWDVTRSPGGSSGGTAAALAAGLGYLSVGSDIGGSIRVPAHFCGIYGHKPTLDLVSLQGHLPGGAHTAPGFSTLLAVGGPMARSASDLMLAMRILGGPADYTAKAWKWELPPARHEALRDFRVGYLVDDAYCPVTPETKAALEKTIQALQKAGAKLKPGWPAGFQINDLYDNYMFHLDAFMLSEAPPNELEAAQKEAAAAKETPAGLRSFAEWQGQNLKRLGFRQQWQAYFADVDAFLSPVAFTATFPHDHSQPTSKRTIATSAGPRKYDDLLRWIAVPTLTGCPATVAPVGHGEGGLPIGVQIMGPFWEDATPITFARLLAREIGGFQAPPGYLS